MSTAERPSLLVALGLPAEVAEVYDRLHPQSGRTLERVAAGLMTTPDRLLETVAPLVDAGIVRLLGDRLEVEPLEEVLRGRLRTQAEHAGRVQRLLGGLAEAVDLPGLVQPPDAATRTAPLAGEVWTGGDLLGLVGRLVRGSTGDLRWIRPDQWRSSGEPRMATLIGELTAAGRRSRAIYPVRALRDAPDVLAARAAAGEEIRVVPEVPTRLLVVGDSHAVLPEPAGLADLPLAVVQQRGLVQVLAMWFDEVWARAVVPDVAGGEQPLELRRLLLGQLATGARDEQIAGQLGISLRTVRRRVADLMTELGVESRFQAGVEAARRGWV